MPYELTDDHSCADIGLVVTAGDIASLFRDAAEGLVSIMVDPDSLDTVDSKVIKLKADDPEDLLYKWLSEIIYHKDADLFFPKEFRIERIDDNGRGLEAVMKGEKADRNKHEFKIDVKAVTYYRFKVEKTKNLWKAEVVLDI
jgi:SHS2 domain-containing protein